MFATIEIFIHKGIPLVENGWPLLSNDEVEVLLSNLNSQISSMRKFWSYCMYGSSTKANSVSLQYIIVYNISFIIFL